MQNNNTPQVLITPLKPALIMGMAPKPPVLVRLQAPDPDPAQKKDRNGGKRRSSRHQNQKWRHCWRHKMAAYS